jgi:hypothetical protein
LPHPPAYGGAPTPDGRARGVLCVAPLANRYPIGTVLRPGRATMEPGRKKEGTVNDTQTTTLEIEEPDAPLSGLDRCDSCGAQAYVRATMESGTLLFCAHHAAKHRDAMMPLAKVWHDETAKLQER